MIKTAGTQLSLTLKKAKLLPWTKFKPLRSFKLSKNSKAAIVTNGHNRPQFFILDTFALLDVLSAIDEPLSDRLSSKNYHSKSINPAGWLIDEIESQIPLNPKLVASLKKAVAESNKKGWIPLHKIQTQLKIS